MNFGRFDISGSGSKMENEISIGQHSLMAGLITRAGTTVQFWRHILFMGKIKGKVASVTT